MSTSSLTAGGQEAEHQAARIRVCLMSCSESAPNSVLKDVLAKELEVRQRSIKSE